MRRARFAVSDGEGINERASVRDALTFDLRAPDTSDDDNLASQRVAMFDLAPLLLGATHLVWGLACFLVHPMSIFAPLELQPARSASGCAGAVDALAYVGAQVSRDQLDLSPRMRVTRAVRLHRRQRRSVDWPTASRLDCTRRCCQAPASSRLAFGAGLGAGDDCRRFPRRRWRSSTPSSPSPGAVAVSRSP